MSSIRWFPQGILAHDHPFCTKTQLQFRGSDKGATPLLSLEARLPGLAETTDQPDSGGESGTFWIRGFSGGSPSQPSAPHLTSCSGRSAPTGKIAICQNGGILIFHVHYHSFKVVPINLNELALEGLA